MNHEGYKQALHRIAWAYVLIYFDFNIGILNIFPDWVGYIMILTTLDTIAEQEPSAKLLGPFGFVLAIDDIARWCSTFLGGEIALPWLDVIVGLINLYFHFQLLTNLADIAQRDGSAYAKKLRVLRTLQTLYITVWTLLDLGTVTLESDILSIIMGAGLIVLLIGLVACLFAYKNELRFDLLIPGYVQFVLDRLTDVGYEAYVVGGCVRDALMEKIPSDWDVCTSAEPDETLAAFADQKTIETGLKHGTVTVLVAGNPVEVTTYRIDGEYEDSRHPKGVVFTRRLEEDLARRDFTINAMAYHPDKGIVDLYGGRDDLQRGILRCVGDPDKRFSEDALRIMRGLRFASVLDFSIEFETDMAMRYRQDGLCKISKERIQAELSKLLMGVKADQIVTNYIDVLETAAPGMQLPKRDLNVMPAYLSVRLAEVFPEDTETYLRTLRFDSQMIQTTSTLSALRDEEAPVIDIVEMKFFLRQHGEEIAKLHYERAGVLAQLEEVLAQNPCYRVKDLKISGEDLQRIGFKAGPEIGRVLNYLLEQVIQEMIENETAPLLDAAKEELDHE